MVVGFKFRELFDAGVWGPEGVEKVWTEVEHALPRLWAVTVIEFGLCKTLHVPLRSPIAQPYFRRTGASRDEQDEATLSAGG